MEIVRSSKFEILGWDLKVWYSRGNQLNLQFTNVGFVYNGTYIPLSTNPTANQPNEQLSNPVHGEN